MKADNYSKMSNYVLYGFFAVILIVFAVFFCVGEEQILPPASETSGEEGKPFPEYTDLVIYLCYAMVAISVSLVLVFESIALVNSFKHNKKGMQKKLLRVFLVSLAVVGLYLISPDKWDFVLYLQYVLLAIAALSMLGSFVISKLRS